MVARCRPPRSVRMTASRSPTRRDRPRSRPHELGYPRRSPSREGLRWVVKPRRHPQRPVAVGVEAGELGVDVDGVGAVEVYVLVVAGPDVGEHLLVDPTAGVAQRGDGQAVVLRHPAHDGVGGQGQTPHLFGLLLVMAPPQRALVGVGQRAAQRVQVLALVQLPPDASPIRFVGQVVNGVEGAAQGAVLLHRRGQGALLAFRRAQLAHDHHGGGVPAVHRRGHPQEIIPP